MSDLYNRGKVNLLDIWDWADAGVTVKVMLVTGSYSFSPDHNVRDDITNEITNTSYTAGGNAVVGRTVTQDDTLDRAVYDATDTVFSAIAAGDLPAGGIIYRDTGDPLTDDLVCMVDFATPLPVPDGSPFAVLWNSDGVFNLP